MRPRSPRHAGNDLLAGRLAGRELLAPDAFAPQVIRSATKNRSEQKNDQNENGGFAARFSVCHGCPPPEARAGNRRDPVACSRSPRTSQNRRRRQDTNRPRRWLCWVETSKVSKRAIATGGSGGEFPGQRNERTPDRFFFDAITLSLADASHGEVSESRAGIGGRFSDAQEARRERNVLERSGAGAAGFQVCVEDGSIAGGNFAREAVFQTSFELRAGSRSFVMQGQTSFFSPFCLLVNLAVTCSIRVCACKRPMSLARERNSLTFTVFTFKSSISASSCTEKPSTFFQNQKLPVFIRNFLQHALEQVAGFGRAHWDFQAAGRGNYAIEPRDLIFRKVGLVGERTDFPFAQIVPAFVH